MVTLWGVLDLFSDAHQGLHLAVSLAVGLAVAAAAALATRRKAKPEARTPSKARYNAGSARLPEAAVPSTREETPQSETSLESTRLYSSLGTRLGEGNDNQQIPGNDAAVYEAVLERAGSEAWGFAWHVGAHAERRLIVARVDPSSPVGQWCSAEKALGRRGIERGDEVISVNGFDEYGGVRRELAAAGKVRLCYRPAGQAENLGCCSGVVGGGGVKGALARRRFAAKAAFQESDPNSPCSGDSPCSPSGVLAEAVALSTEEKQDMDNSGSVSQDNIPRADSSPSSAVCRKLPLSLPQSSPECFVKNTFIEVNVSRDIEIDRTRCSVSDPSPILGLAASIPRSSPYIPGSLAGLDLTPSPSGGNSRSVAKQGTVPDANGSLDSSGTWASADSNGAQWPQVSLEPSTETKASNPVLTAAAISIPPVPSSSPTSGAATPKAALSTDTEMATAAPSCGGPLPEGPPSPHVLPACLQTVACSAGAMDEHVLYQSTLAPSVDPQFRRPVPPSLDELQSPPTTSPPSTPASLGAVPVVAKKVPVPDLGPVLAPFAPSDASVEVLSPITTDTPLGSEDVKSPMHANCLSSVLSSSTTGESSARRKPTRRGGRRARHRKLAALARQQTNAGVDLAEEDDGDSGSEDPDQNEQMDAARSIRVPTAESSRIPLPSSTLSSSFPVQPAVENTMSVETQELVGKRVLISGLVRSPEYNMQWGRVESYDAELQRYLVRMLLGNSGEAQVLAKLRRENLIVPKPVELRFTDGPAGQETGNASLTIHSANTCVPNTSAKAVLQQSSMPPSWPWCGEPAFVMLPAGAGAGVSTPSTTDVAATAGVPSVLPQTFPVGPVPNPGPATEFEDSGGGSLLLSLSPKSRQELGTPSLRPTPSPRLPKSPGPAADFEDSVGLSLFAGTPQSILRDTSRRLAASAAQ